MKRSRTWIGFALVGVLAAGVGFMARGAVAGDEAAAHEGEKPIDGHALVKALAGTWTTKAKTNLGDMAGQVTYGLECGKTVLATRYTTKGKEIGEMHGFGVLKISADGKTATQWWFDSGMDTVLMMTGPVTETGFSIEGSNKLGASKVTLEKKGAGFEMKIFADGAEFSTETYTKAK